jgi:signal transduction histidine kinase
VTRRQLAGDVAAELALQLADPLRQLRDRLGTVLDQLEQHVAKSTGPTPYPWRSLQVLRQDLASTYLEATQLAQRMDELDHALHDAPPDWFDLSAATDLGLRLAATHLAPGIELLFDLGHSPTARGTPGTLALVVAQLVAFGARSAREVPGSSLSVRVTSDGAWCAVHVADNGGASESAGTLADLVRAIVAPWGASIDGHAEAGQGSSFELRLIAHP